MQLSSSRYLASRWLQRLTVDSLAKTNASCSLFTDSNYSPAMSQSSASSHSVRLTSHFLSSLPKDSAVSTALPDLSKGKRKGVTTSLIMILLANLCNCTLLKIN